jgi:hypothetical protein
MSRKLVNGGYLLGKPSVRSEWHTAHLVPKRVLSASSCLTDFVPESELSGCVPDSPELMAALRAEFQLTDGQISLVRSELLRMAQAGEFEYPRTFLTSDAARRFLPLLGQGGDGLLLFGISTTPANARAMIDDEADHTYCHTAVLARGLAPEDGEALGWEPLGTDYCGFHSWYCCGIERVAEGWGITPNAHGFIDAFEDAERVAAYCNEGHGEPGYWAPWRITHYPI